MAIPTYNTQQTDGGYSPTYRPWNPFANQQPPKQAARKVLARPIQRQFPQQFPQWSPWQLPPPIPMPIMPVMRAPLQTTVQRQGLLPRPTASQSQQAQRAAAQMQVDIRQRQFLNDLRAGKFATPYEEWQASGGVNRQLTDWFDPYDPAGSPYMTSQYIPQTNYDGYGGYGGYGGGWGGWGGGGGYAHQDSASFYQGNYTQRRNRWNETLLTWGLRQQ